MTDHLQVLIDDVRVITDAADLESAKLKAEMIIKRLIERKVTNNRTFADSEDDDSPERACEAYTIDEEELENRAEEGGYWADALKFYMDVKDRFTTTLQPRQLAWLAKLEKQLDEDINRY